MSTMSSAAIWALSTSETLRSEASAWPKSFETSVMIAVARALSASEAGAVSPARSAAGCVLGIGIEPAMSSTFAGMEGTWSGAASGVASGAAAAGAVVAGGAVVLAFSLSLPPPPQPASMRTRARGVDRWFMASLEAGRLGERRIPV
jgi:hypothetical protein